MIKREELAEVIKDLIPEGPDGDSYLERIAQIDVYPEGGDDPGPEWVRKSEMDAAAAEYSRKIREIFFGGRNPEGGNETAEDPNVPTEPAREMTVESEEEEDFSLDKL